MHDYPVALHSDARPPARHQGARPDRTGGEPGGGALLGRGRDHDADGKRPRRHSQESQQEWRAEAPSWRSDGDEPSAAHQGCTRHGAPCREVGVTRLQAPIAAQEGSGCCLGGYLGNPSM